MADQLPRVQHSRAPHDSAEWCAERAAADSSAAAVALNDNIRLRFKLSAASWLARARMLEKIADNIRTRTDIVRAKASKPSLLGHPA